MLIHDHTSLAQFDNGFLETFIVRREGHNVPNHNIVLYAPVIMKFDTCMEIDDKDFCGITIITKL